MRYVGGLTSYLKLVNDLPYERYEEVIAMMKAEALNSGSE